MSVSWDKIQKANNILARYIGTKLHESIGEIRSQFPDFQIDEISADSLCTADFRYDRIRVIYRQDSFGSRDKFIIGAGVG